RAQRGVDLPVAQVSAHRRECTRAQECQSQDQNLDIVAEEMGHRDRGRDQAVGGLDAYAEPDQVTRHLEVGPGDARVGHPAGVLDQRLDATERLPEYEHLRLRAHVEGMLLPAGDTERHDPAVPRHLAAGNLMAGVDLEPWVDDLTDRRVASEEL